MSRKKKRDKDSTELGYFKSIWRKKDNDVFKIILHTLDTNEFGQFNAEVYSSYWKELLFQRLKLECDPMDYIKAFKYESFQEYFDKTRRT